MTIKRPRTAGFTLMELLVVITIIGILAGFAVPSYMKSVEVSKADDAVALVNMIGTTNKMFALDHSNTYTTGNFPTAVNSGCGNAVCPAVGPYAACALVWCKYLADQNFGSKPYTFTACDPTGGACGTTGNNMTAGAKRKATSAPYSGWGYSQDASGVIINYGAAPTPTY